ncbi:hypothetical protein [Novipirellula aureliae]|uniref:hypothetical protein n=1 Tax=Novipirellula aureliae TaxID=2527966 RepID=UPI0018CD0618|nr:hypothetical protein [Novipirellula aureliae]
MSHKRLRILDGFGVSERRRYGSVFWIWRLGETPLLKCTLDLASRRDAATEVYFGFGVSERRRY